MEQIPRAESLGAGLPLESRRSALSRLPRTDCLIVTANCVLLEMK